MAPVFVIGAWRWGCGAKLSARGAKIMAATVLAIATLLGVYGAGFIFFTDSTADIILNTLASMFVLTIDDIIYTVIMPKLGKAALQQDKHQITFASEQISGGIHKFTIHAWMVMVIGAILTYISTAWCDIALV